MSAAHHSGLRVRELSVRLPAQAVPLLSAASLGLDPGEVVGVCGRSGAGKSTLLHALAGLLPWSRRADVRGEITLDGEGISDLDPGQRAHLFATCLDRATGQLFLSTARHELAAAKSLHGETPLTEAIVRALDLAPLLDRPITGLSSGERQRVALAVALAAAPRPVLLDEPTVHLDGRGVRALVGVLREVRALGGAVIVTEQAGWRIADGVDRWLELRGGALRPCPPPTAPLFDPLPPPRGPSLLEATGVTLRRAGRTLLEDIDLTVRGGEVMLLSGANGAGKSSLARALAGHAEAGGGITVSRGHIRRAGSVALMLAEANVQLFAETVAGEIALAERDAATAAATLRRHDLEHLSGRAPWTLSRGERQRLLHAALDVLHPAVMIVDEPGQGLDPEALQEVAGVIGSRAREGRAYLIVSHRLELARFAQRHLTIAGRRLVEVEGGA
jgi:energy-coupling factor transporter ATP-binding protein EcfA2